MRGIECAFFGALGNIPELKTSKSGKPWASLAVAVDTGEEAAEGRSKVQWINVAVFGEAAERLNGAPKGTRLYVEGTLTLNEWNAPDGEPRHGLSAAAWKCEKVGASALGRNRPKRQYDGERAASGLAAPAPRTRPACYELDDELHFAPETR
ncbi:MAG: single-stranded DNA-binding protein [Rhodomicrobium sp.]